jgi:hypothetical protein
MRSRLAKGLIILTLLSGGAFAAAPAMAATSAHTGQYGKCYWSNHICYTWGKKGSCYVTINHHRYAGYKEYRNHRYDGRCVLQ